MDGTLPPQDGSGPTVCTTCGEEVPAGGECFTCSAPDVAFPQLSPEAVVGLPGDFVRLMAPISEAHPAALLFEFLATFGCCVGGGPKLDVSGNLQPARLFVAIVGESSHARKSSSRHRVRPVFDDASPGFGARCFGSPSSGEGLLELVRDPECDDQGRVKWGSADRRALVSMPELARLLRAMERSGQTMSPLLREAFDVGTLRIIRRVDPLVSTDPHICLVGNVTGQELFGLMSAMEVWNGFANRFCFVLAGVTPELPFGGTPDPQAKNTLVRRLAGALDGARRVERVGWGSAREQWPEVYHFLRRPMDGPIGAMLARRDTQALRLAITYALCDGSAVIESEHLEAACHAWAYCEASVLHMWERWGMNGAAAEGLQRVSVRTAQDRIARILWARKPGETLSRRELHRMFSANVPMTELERIMAQLVTAGEYVEAEIATGGRTARGWRRV